MSNSKSSKPASSAQIPATRAATSAAERLAALAPTIPEERTTTALMELLTAEFAKQRTSLREDVSFLIQESIKPLQASLDSLQTTMSSFQSRLTSMESVAGGNFERLTASESTIRNLLEFMSEVLLQVMGCDVFPAPPDTGESQPDPDLQIQPRKTSSPVPCLLF